MNTFKWVWKCWITYELCISKGVFRYCWFTFESMVQVRRRYCNSLCTATELTVWLQQDVWLSTGSMATNSHNEMTAVTGCVCLQKLTTVSSKLAQINTSFITIGTWAGILEYRRKSNRRPGKKLYLPISSLNGLCQRSSWWKNRWSRWLELVQ